MIEGIPRISVVIICYKQEDLIKRAINSLLVQRDYIYEICVSDDCSPDKTWEVLQEYEQDYPGLFKLQRHDPNVGIFQNIESTWSMPSGDIICRLAGDDECGEGWLKTVIQYIQDNNIDYKNELFCIYGDYAAVYPNNDYVIVKNDLVKGSKNLLSQALRGMISNRGACYSIKIMKEFKKASLGKSHIAESSIDRQLQVFATHSYYIPKIGNLYHTGVGVSTTIKRRSEIMKEREMQYPYTIKFLSSLGAVISSKDVAYLTSKSLAHTIQLDSSTKKRVLHRFLKLIKSIEGFDFKCFLKKNNLGRIIFSLFRKIPHSTPWHYTA